MAPDQFNFLIVPVGVIVGLSLAHIAISLTHYLIHRERLHFYWVLVVWAGILFIYVIQSWYTQYSYRDFGESFFQYLYFLVNPLLTYGAIVILLPRSEEEKPIDLEEHYFRAHQLFFSICCAIMIDRTILETVVGNHSIFKLMI